MRIGFALHEHKNFNELLLEYGYSPVKAEIWARFVGEALYLIEVAADKLRETDTWDGFCKKRGALSKPNMHKRLSVTERAPIEDALTAELGHIVRKLRAELPSDHFLRHQEAVFETEHLVEGLNSTGRHSRKVDFFIYAQSGPAAPELAIEAKPLKSAADIERRYLGDDGIGCFFTGDPVYTQESVAVMLAYTMCKSGAPFRDKIFSALEVYKPMPLAVESAKIPPIKDAFPCSRHSRQSLSLEPIAIIHLELRFAPEITTTKAT